MITAQEAQDLIVRALEYYAAQHPTPTHVTTKQAAEMLKVSVWTVRRLKLRRNELGMIPYEDVLAVRSAR